MAKETELICNLTLVISTCDPMCSMFMHLNVENSDKTFRYLWQTQFIGLMLIQFLCNIVVDALMVVNLIVYNGVCRTINM